MQRRELLTKTLNRVAAATASVGVINPFGVGRSAGAARPVADASAEPEVDELENGRRALAGGVYRLAYEWWTPKHRRFRLRFPVERSTYRAAKSRSRGYLSAFDAARSARTAERLAGAFASVAVPEGAAPDWRGTPPADGRPVLLAGTGPGSGPGSESDIELAPRDRLAAAVAFARSFEYAVDAETTGLPEYHRDPAETLVDGRGDCKDITYLLGGLLSRPPFEYRTAMVIVPEHMLVGVRRADLPDGVDADALPGTDYVPVETTRDEPIGSLSREPLLAVYDRGFEYLDERASAATAGHLLSNPAEIDVLNESI